MNKLELTMIARRGHHLRRKQTFRGHRSMSAAFRLFSAAGHWRESLADKHFQCIKHRLRIVLTLPTRRCSCLLGSSVLMASASLRPPAAIPDYVKLQNVAIPKKLTRIFAL